MSENSKEKTNSEQTSKKKAVEGKTAKLVKPAEKKVVKDKKVAKDTPPSEEAVAKAISLLQNSVPTEETELTVDGGNSEMESNKAPPILEVDNASKNLLIMHKPWCFKCSHFVSTDATRAQELKKYKECHYMKGNDLCPAKHNRMILGTPIEESAQELYDATISGDLERDVELRRKLSKFDPIIQQKVLHEYRRLLGKSAD